MIHTVTLNPAIDATITVSGLAIGAVNRAAASRRDPGGKGVNVSKAVAALGGRSVAWALLGGDAGRWISARLEEAGIACRAFEAEGETRTNCKIVDPASHETTDINEAGCEVARELLDGMLGALAAEARPGDIVVLAGSLPRGAAAGTYGAWTGRLKAAGAEVFLDAEGEALLRGIEAGPHYVKPNDHELSELVGRRLEGPAEVAAAARGLREKGVREVVVSMGAAGAVLVDADGAWHASAPKVEAGSTVGAGDAVDAAFAHAEERGLGREEALRLAMAAGAAAAMGEGTQAPERSKVEGLMGEVAIRRLA